jgi:hypothetical protein
MAALTMKTAALVVLVVVHLTLLEAVALPQLVKAIVVVTLLETVLVAQVVAVLVVSPLTLRHHLRPT